MFIKLINIVVLHFFLFAIIYTLQKRVFCKLITRQLYHHTNGEVYPFIKIEIIYLLFFELVKLRKNQNQRYTYCLAFLILLGTTISLGHIIAINIIVLLLKSKKSIFFAIIGIYGS